MFKWLRKQKPAPDDPPSLPWLTCQRAAGVLAWVVVGQTAGIIGLAAWHQTHPVTKEVPYYVEFSTGGNNFVRVTPAGEAVQGNQTLLSSVIRSYVIKREPITKTDEGGPEGRYAYVEAQSTDQVFKTFKEMYGGKDSLYYKPGFKREVIITRDSPIGPWGGGVHQVEFRTIDTIEGSGMEPIKNEWVATMNYEFRPREVPADDKLLNPTGLFVTEYTVSRRSTGR